MKCHENINQGVYLGSQRILYLTGILLSQKLNIRKKKIKAGIVMKTLFCLFP